MECLTRDCDTGPGTWGEWEENGKRTAGRGSRCPGSGGKRRRGRQRQMGGPGEEKHGTSGREMVKQRRNRGNETEAQNHGWE